MSVLVDWQIRVLSVGGHRGETQFAQGRPLLEPFSEGKQGDHVISYGLTSSGYDLRLGYSYFIFKNPRNVVVCPKRMKKDKEYQKQFLEEVKVGRDGKPLDFGSEIEVPGHSYILAYSLEYIRVPRWLKGHCTGKSTYARMGLITNTTPLEPAWEGHLTIEIANSSPSPTAIYAGEGICQLEFVRLDQPPETDYAQKGGKYQNQGAEPVPATVKS
jgi:dCTP deaminase